MFAGNIASFGQEGVLQLVTLRSNGQFNTTVYSYEDRFRGVKGTRMLVFMNEADIAKYGLMNDDLVDLTTAMDGDTVRGVNGFRVVPTTSPRAVSAPISPRPIRWCRCRTTTRRPTPPHTRRSLSG
jgi:anaerobic selenocysteine-containing dehydrogenase